MDNGILAWVIPLATLFGGAVGWIGRQYQSIQETKKQAGLDADKALTDEIAALEKRIANTNNAIKKEDLLQQQESLNADLSRLRIARAIKDIKSANLPLERIISTETKGRLKPQQIEQLNKATAEVKNLPLSDSILRDLRDISNAHYYTGQYQEAKEIDDIILKLNPDNPSTLNNHGVTLHALGRYDEALADYNRALSIKPNYVDALNNRGIVYSNLGRHDEALADYNDALSLKPDDVEALYNRGNTYFKIEKYDEALADYNRALSLKPDDIEALNNRGNTYFKIEKYDEALADYNRSLALKQDYAEALNNRGLTYSKLKKYDKALADYNRALTLKPDYAEAIYNIACAFSLQNKPDDALAYLEKAINKDKKCKDDAKTDTDFNNIRNDPRFTKLIGQ
jgi:tetratricopeptide (TPR) repeat protein